jgi:PPM family protein phosphatase
MKFNISAFTHTGTVRDDNQDYILVNGELLNEGEVHLTEQNYCFCFVADGVGGNKAGKYASHFVLEKLKSEPVFSEINIEQSLQLINSQLLNLTIENEELKGTATTLTGLISNEMKFQIYHTGDSQMWMLRNDMFFKITKDQILDETEYNSPIISHFGGFDNNLSFDKDISINETLQEDIYLICSDGLLKSINVKVIKSILNSEKTIDTKLKKILENCLQSVAEDNISVILIQNSK